MNKVVYEVWVVDMEDKLLLASKENSEEEITTIRSAEAWALDLSDNANVKYAFVIERRKVRTYEGKGLIIKRSQEANDAKGKKNVGADDSKEPPPPSPETEQ